MEFSCIPFHLRIINWFIVTYYTYYNISAITFILLSFIDFLPLKYKNSVLPKELVSKI